VLFRSTASWQHDFTLTPRATLTLGLDWQDDEVASSVAYTVKNRDNTGVYAQLLAGAGAHDFRVALRHDDNSQFGSNLTGNAAWGMDLGHGLRSHVNLGTAFKAPTFNELYYPGFGTATLQPEKSQSMEAGLNGSGGPLRWSATLFENRIHDLINFDGTTNPSNASARIRGLETTLRTRLADWDVRTALTLQDPENTSDTVNKGKLLNRRAQQNFRLDLDRDFGAWRMGATLRLDGKRYDNLANSVKLGGYGLVDLRGEVRLASDWRLQGRVENLFDKTYQTAAGYNQPGAGAYVTLVYQPKP
jgi:vitamin B12 transporter